MKGLFKSKPKTPVDLVRQTRDLLIFVDLNPETRESKREEKRAEVEVEAAVIESKSGVEEWTVESTSRVAGVLHFAELGKLLRELKQILYGNSEAEPVSEACARLTQEFFRENTLCLLIICLPKLNLEARKDATQVVANLQRQQVQSRLIACDYLEANIDLMDILVSGYEDTDMALHYGAMLRECIRHQSVARYVLESEHIKKFFNFIQLPNFDIAADAAATFKRRYGSCALCKELMTRHKSTVAEFLSKNYDWVEYNSKLLESPNYITRRQAIKESIADQALTLESSKSIQIEAFHVFKLFAANQRKPADIIGILVANRSKLLRLFADFKPDKEDEQFEADKAQVVREIAGLEPQD
ncbi:Armadillo-like helical [Cynara cardunculus var. scolymus]|uniref:Armadillo-like helical n=1 Tax=Cynara cardunculus var. scolymus TaxID=59895 RepID=A0A103XTS3_CYNCS|nr:Armadillo-like helical [Cynara cardunculus var. scolymus]